MKELREKFIENCERDPVLEQGKSMKNPTPKRDGVAEAAWENKKSKRNMF